MKTIVILKKTFEEIEALTFVDYLRRAGIDVKMVSMEEDLFVEGGHGIQVKADILFENLKEESIDLLYIPGGMPAALDLHLANDAGLIKHKIKYDIIRSGICLHGVYPSAYIKENYPLGLEPVFTWLSKVSHIKHISRGDSISYARTFIADRRMKIATVSIGYADGYKRLISNRGYVLIKGKRANIVGNITMDQMMVDITDIDCKVYDDVVLIGRSNDEYIAVEDLATWAETIPYEIMTSISKRVQRVFKQA